MESKGQQETSKESVEWRIVRSRYDKETNTLLKIFPSLPISEVVIEVFPCNQSNGGLLELFHQGTMFFTHNYLCFFSGNTTKSNLLIRLADVTDILENSGYNTIDIHYQKRNKVSFSFGTREKQRALDLLKFLREQCDHCSTSFDRFSKSSAISFANLRYPIENKQFHEQFPEISLQETLLEFYTCSLDELSQQGRLYFTSDRRKIYFHSKSLLTPDFKESISLQSIRSISSSSSSSSSSSNSLLQEMYIETHIKKYIFKKFSGCKIEDCLSLLLFLWNHFKTKAVFGVPLEILLERDNCLDTCVPHIVTLLTEAINQSVCLVEGIFRISPSKSELERVQSLIDEGEYVNLTELCSSDKHLVPSLLKKFFRDLPAPLFTFEFYSCFIAVYEQKDLFDEALLIRKLSDLIKMLPSIHYKLVRFLLSFIASIANKSESNLMTINNLATVWAPVLFRTEEMEMNVRIIKETGESASLLAIILNKHKELFVY